MFILGLICVLCHRMIFLLELRINWRQVGMTLQGPGIYLHVCNIDREDAGKRCTSTIRPVFIIKVSEAGHEGVFAHMSTSAQGKHD